MWVLTGFVPWNVPVDGPSTMKKTPFKAVSQGLMLAFVLQGAAMESPSGAGSPRGIQASDPAPPPAGFDLWRDGIPHGRIVTEAYESKTVGGPRPLMIYLPPGYLPTQQYPVLYLLHGIADVETSWWRKGSLDTIFDNLYADGKLVPMLVVMPNGRASAATIETPWEDQFPAFDAFEADLLNSLIPWVESRYSVLRDRGSRALAGLSLGGGQALNIGIVHPETFTWIGSFSPASRIRFLRSNPVGPGKATGEFFRVWLSCGDRDPLLAVGREIHETLNGMNVPHSWRLDSGGHTWTVWKGDLHRFSQQLFR